MLQPSEEGVERVEGLEGLVELEGLEGMEGLEGLVELERFKGLDKVAVLAKLEGFAGLEGRSADFKFAFIDCGGEVRDWEEGRTGCVGSAMDPKRRWKPPFSHFMKHENWSEDSENDRGLD